MTMISTINSTFWIMFFQASTIGECHSDQKIHMIKSMDGGNTWSDPPQVVASGYHAYGNHSVAVWGPATLYSTKQKRLYLYFSKSVPQNIRGGGWGCNFPGGEIHVQYSDNFGVTWSKSEMILPYDNNEYGYGNVSKMTANKPVFLSADEDSWALPMWAEPHTQNLNDTGKQVAALLVTVDGGRTHAPFSHLSWNATAAGTTKSWLIENWVFVLRNVAPTAASALTAVPLQQGFRTQLLFMLDSVALGGIASGFSRAEYTKIPNPDSKTSAAALYPNNNDWQNSLPVTYALACNNDFVSRSLLSVFSCQYRKDRVKFENEGTNVLVIEDNTTWQSDYPTTVQGVVDGQIIVTYTCYSHSGVCLAIIDNFF